MQKVIAAIFTLAFLTPIPEARAGVVATTYIPIYQGSGGIFLEMTSYNNPLNINEFVTYVAGTPGESANVEIWTRPGQYSGFTGDSAGWTLTQTVTTSSYGKVNLSTPLNLTTPLFIPQGETLSVYLQGTTAGHGIYYYNGFNFLGDSELSVYTDVARVSSVAFEGSEFTPRSYLGAINYSISSVPEPTCGGLLACVALGLVGVILVRRRSELSN